MRVHLCKGDETLEQALAFINDPDGVTYTFDQEADRCYIGDEVFVNAPVLINYKNSYYALHIAE